ncbi:tryptophan 7-halogenase [uncultured Tateyamaria sp.]|uniref:tryptophan 7-halogenase n=1 Tax=uncultured Tateyamaria sp. TaxID=455651 RepID=UPI002637D273|nr:tryptophan 7-halogenase [uncultured Tateyamaria sp.]
MDQHVDVAIIGGGPAGTAAALTLCKRSDISVTVLERGAYAQPKVGESLSPGVRGLLQYLDLWDRFEQEQRLSLLGSEAAWGNDTLGTMDFILTLHGAGWALDRQRFEQMMADEVERRGVPLQTETSVMACHHDGAVWHLDLGDRVMTARYVIDAAGRTSRLSLRDGAHRQRNDTLMAISTRWPRADDARQMTRVEAFEDGWWYAAPLPTGDTILCLFSDAERIHALRLSDPQVWADHLSQTQHIKPLIKAGQTQLSQLETLPAFSSLLSRGDPNTPMVAAGDAIAARDPLSSSGIPNAISSGIQAARVAADWLFGTGALKPAYLDGVAQDHAAYLKTHWRTYRTEDRWADAPFWRFRSAQVTRGPGARVCAAPNGDTSLFVPGHVARWIAGEAQRPTSQLDLVRQARQTFPDIPDERLLLAIEDLTIVADTAPSA